MFDRFTDRSRKAMALAHKEALRLGQDHIGTEHVLLGLIQEGSGIAANVLKNLGVGISKIRLVIEKRAGSVSLPGNRGQLPFTPRVKKALEYAIEEADRLSHSYIGTEHLLLGIIRDDADLAVQALRASGLSVEEIRAETMGLIGACLNQKTNEPDPASEPDRKAKVRQDSDGIVLLDDGESIRARIGLTEDKQPSVSLYDKDNVERVVLRLEADGSPVFELRDKDGFPVFELKQKDGSPILELKDKDGRVLFKAP